MDQKMMMRKKAMDMMMKEGPSMKMPMKKSSMMDMGEDSEAEGYEQMMVSPAEKQMILAIREKSGANTQAEEAPEEQMGANS